MKPTIHPAPQTVVACGHCRHFEPDPIGFGGIGRCAAAGEGTKHPTRPLFPRALRACREFVAQEAAG